MPFDKVYHISNGLKMHMLTFVKTREEADAIVTALDSYIADIEPFKRSHPERQRRDLNVLMDDILKTDITRQDADKVITCRKGCAHCCKQLVMITEPEAMKLVELAQTKHIALDRDRLKRQAQCDDEGWLALEQQDRRCPFLGADDLCQVYDDRPLACRKFFSISYPDLCDTEKHPHGQVQIWYSPDAEVLTTAAFTALDSCSMPQAILKQMGDRP